MYNSLNPCKIYIKWVYYAIFEHKDEKPRQAFLHKESRSKGNDLHFEYLNFKSTPLN